LIVFSGPSGVGKDAVITTLKEQGVDLHFAVTVTTRAPRPGEIDGVHYYFVSTAEFEAMQARDELLEWALVHGNYYGTPRLQTRQALAAGKDVMLKIDVQGAAQVKHHVPDAVFIFLAPPAQEQLIERLRGRGTESPDDLKRRIENSRAELARLPEYDYQVINYDGRLVDAAEQIKAIICAEKLRVHPRNIVV
jgi:guanylate kinase